MHKLSFAFIISLFLTSLSASAQLYLPEQSDKINLEITPKVGFAFGKSSFNISGNEQGLNPNILSELIWTNTQSILFGFDVQLKKRNFLVNSSLLFSKNLSGDVSDIDYASNNRQDPYSELYLSNHKGNGATLIVEPGVLLPINTNNTIHLFGSFEYNNQQNYLLNYSHWNANSPEYLDRLNSYYKYKFINFGIGASIRTKLGRQFESTIGLTGHYSPYYAYGNWNLITDFEHPISYEHKANGFKIKPSLDLSYHINSSLAMHLNYVFNYFYTENGKDYLYSKADGLIKTKLNEAKFSNSNILLSLTKKINQ